MLSVVAVLVFALKEVADGIGIVACQPSEFQGWEPLFALVSEPSKAGPRALLEQFGEQLLAGEELFGTCRHILCGLSLARG